ncbi:MAG: hypothetical protein LAO24_18000 [Acidobacteriia bacterium]|nr:hypothetical protein [Terriglobia bacterium]
MNNFICRLSLAAALILGVTVLGGIANAQEPSSQDPATATPPQQQSPAAQDQQAPTATPQESPTSQQQQDEPRMPAASKEAQSQDAQAFTGRIVKENGKVVLKDPVTKNSYQIDDTAKVKPYMGKEVKVTGKLDMSSNTIHVESVGPMS